MTQNGTILFVNLNKTVSTSGQITSGKYSVLLVGGQSYAVEAGDLAGYPLGTYTIYIPLGVSTFTANF